MYHTNIIICIMHHTINTSGRQNMKTITHKEIVTGGGAGEGSGVGISGQGSRVKGHL